VPSYSNETAAAWHQLNALGRATSGDRQPVGDHQHSVAGHGRHRARVAARTTLFMRRTECWQEEFFA